MTSGPGWFAYSPRSELRASTKGGAGILGPDVQGLASAAEPPDGSPERPPELADLTRLARRGLRSVLRVARAPEPTTAGSLIRSFLGELPPEAGVVRETWAGYENVNVQAGLNAWLAESGRGHTLLGIATSYGEASLATMLSAAPQPVTVVGTVSRDDLPCGPGGRTLACVIEALYLVDDPLGPVAAYVAMADPQRGRQSTTVEWLSADPGLASSAAARVRQLSIEHNVFRGQVLTFGEEVFGYGQSALTFHERPAMTGDDLILADGVLAAIERQVVGVGRHREALRAAGQHLKRGLLLYGPPGVGKTHTVRYLISVLPTTTVIQISGSTLGMIGQACSVARALQPALVVVEDVDLIAEDRHYTGGTPLLFELLNAMDGLDGDGDVTFVLTTNRADLLEEALVARPGRVDQAVHLDLPDLDERRRLFRLYQGRLIITADDAEIDEVLRRSHGVTASFLKELLRRAALLAAERPARPLAVAGADLASALEDLLSTHNPMTRLALDRSQDEPAWDGYPSGPEAEPGSGPTD